LIERCGGFVDRTGSRRASMSAVGRGVNLERRSTGILPIMNDVATVRHHDTHQPGRRYRRAGRRQRHPRIMVITEWWQKAIEHAFEHDHPARLCDHKWERSARWLDVWHDAGRGRPDGLFSFFRLDEVGPAVVSCWACSEGTSKIVRTLVCGWARSWTAPADDDVQVGGRKRVMRVLFMFAAARRQQGATSKQ